MPLPTCLPYAGPVTECESATLAAQWVAAWATVAAVLVAAVFGWLTLVTSRRAKDAQVRASYAAAEDGFTVSADFADAVTAVSRVNWEVSREAGENWLLRNAGGTTAYNVAITGLTVYYSTRLTTADPIGDVGPTHSVAFVYTSN